MKEKRQAHFSQDEDFILCCAFVNVSVDPVIGVGQKSEPFWTQVLEKYLLLTEKHLSDYGAEFPVQNSASLQQHWKKKIAHPMQLWNKILLANQVSETQCLERRQLCRGSVKAQQGGGGKNIWA
jgi:hypothetical protein